MENAIIQLAWNHNSISFRGDDGWVNATEMAKPFRKLVADFTRLKATDRFIQALAASDSVMGIPITVVQGGATQGTWMHPDLALEFARWLSPEFAIWTNRIIRDILSGGGKPSPAPSALRAEDIVGIITAAVRETITAMMPVMQSMVHSAQTPADPIAAKRMTAADLVCPEGEFRSAAGRPAKMFASNVLEVIGDRGMTSGEIVDECKRFFNISRTPVIQRISWLYAQGYLYKRGPYYRVSKFKPYREVDQ